MTVAVPKLTVLDELPEALRTASAGELHTFLPGPTLIHLPGRRLEPLFVSVLLHGNEDVGLRAIQTVLAVYLRRELPRALSIFIGNVDAAKVNLRRLDGQPDYNRVWTDDAAASPERELMAAVQRDLAERRVFASIDLHNNTGHNPYYACVTELAHAHLHLASLFSRTVVHFRQPRGVQTMAFARLCPSVTCECGRVGDAGGVARAAEFVEAALNLETFPDTPVPAGDVHLFHTAATVKVRPEATMSFDGAPATLRFRSDFDWFNFREIEPGTVFAQGAMAGLEVLDGECREVTEVYLEDFGGDLRLRRTVMPSMLTLDERVIRQDCLGYFMERLALPA